MDDSSRDLHFDVHWITGHITKGNVKLSRTGQHRWTTPDTVLEMIRNLNPDHSDSEIATLLTRAGKTTPHGLQWSVTRVRGIRMYHKIMKPAQRSEDIIGCGDAREILGICYHKFRELIKEGKLHGEQAYSNARWRISKKEVEGLASQFREQS